MAAQSFPKRFDSFRFHSNTTAACRTARNGSISAMELAHEIRVTIYTIQYESALSPYYDYYYFTTLTLTKSSYMLEI